MRTDVGAAVGSLLVVEATTPVLEQALLEIATRSRSSAKRARAMLRMIFDEAVRLGLAPVNPVVATSHFRPPHKEVVSLPIDDVRAIRLDLGRV